MKNTLWFLFACIVLSGCITKEKCNQRFPPISTVHDSIVIKDTTIIVHDTVTIEGNEVILFGEVPCPELSFSNSATNKGLTATVSIAKGKVKVICKQDSLQAIIETKDRQIETYRTIKDNKVTTKTEFYNHWYDPFCRWYTLITLTLITIYVAVRVIMKIYTGK